METSEEHYNQKEAEILTIYTIYNIRFVCPKCGKEDTYTVPINRNHKGVYFSRCKHCCQYVTLTPNKEPKDEN